MNMQSVEVFAVGTWNGFKFVEEDLKEIVNNTTALILESRLKPPVKLGHSNNQILKGQTDGDPALGWITAIRQEGEKIVADFKNIPEILISAIEQERYKQVSVELKHTENFGWFLTGIAFLGADTPAVKTLEDLQAFLSEKRENIKSVIKDAANIGNPEIALHFSEPKIHFEKVKMEETKDLTLEFAAVKAELEQLKKEKELVEVQAKEIQFSSKKEEIMNLYKKDVQDGKLMPAALPKIELSIDSQKQEFISGKGISFSAEFTHSLSEFYSVNLNSKEQATDEKKVEMSGDEALHAEIVNVMKSTGKDYIEASSIVFSADEKLLENYKEFTLSVK